MLTSAFTSLLLILTPVMAASPPQQLGQVTGVVVDASGAPVVGAIVHADVDSVRAASTRTSSGGRFTVSGLPTGPVLLTIASPGFSEVRLTLEAATSDPVHVVLQPAALHESVSVTASRGLDELTTPSSTVALTSADLANSAAGAIDDTLRNTPGFGLTRRSSSRVANPSTQGVSMRGLPGNAGSRTLVLADGFPLNDQFGGWVYWNRMPEAAIERIEVVRGATGDLYGGDAVSGVIQLFAFSPSRSQFRGTVDIASPQTSRGSLFGARKAGPWEGSVAGEWVATDGVPVVAAAERGKVDVNATSNYRTGFVTGGYAGRRWTARLRAAAYVERRGNGTPLVVNSTDWRQYSGDLSGDFAGGTLTVQSAVGRQHYYNNFSSVPAGRATERVTSEQWLPSTFQTAGAQWKRPWRSAVFLVGGDSKRTDADVNEYRFAVSGARSGPFVSGGTERVSSLYGRAAIAASRTVSVVVGGRGDFWRSTPREAGEPSHAVNFFSPRVSIGWQMRPAVALRASLTHAYRTPTLDELHRSSQVGNTMTLGNTSLNPEVLTGLEFGALLTGPRVSTRITGFWNNLTDAITNITLTTTPSLITKQKQNSDTVRAQGLELEADFRPYRGLTMSGSIVLTSSRYRHEIKLPALEGHQVPQIPFYQAALGVAYSEPRIGTLAAQVRAAGRQYEDDLNTLVLTPFRVVDVSISRPVARALQAYLAVENLFNVEIQTGRTPVTKIGWPRTVRVGLRVVLP